ncbi:hypothetical protein Ddc_05734 [Ditylenchus destructor]|nr:hypothetical protein Ddc_05734 [Ditylenchus destructor]
MPPRVSPNYNSSHWNYVLRRLCYAATPSTLMHIITAIINYYAYKIETIYLQANESKEVKSLDAKDLVWLLPCGEATVGHVEKVPA